MGARTLVGATVGLRARRSQLGFGLGPKQYNYEHFRRRHLAEEVGGSSWGEASDRARWPLTSSFPR